MNISDPDPDPSADPSPAAVPGRLIALRQRIAAACRRAGRLPEEVTLLGVSKQQPEERIRAALAAGLRVFGENRVQEARAKVETFGQVWALGKEGEIEWHLIGPLQSNKAKLAAEIFSVIHSVDRLKIARALDREAEQLGRVLPCLIEINLGEEESKHGFFAHRIQETAAALAELEHLSFRGLMAIPPFGDTAEASRPWFQRLRRLRDELAAAGPLEGFPGWLSMGMSHDFEVAIEEGATHVRVGTALFGPRGH